MFSFAAFLLFISIFSPLPSFGYVQDQHIRKERQASLPSDNIRAFMNSFANTFSCPTANLLTTLSTLLCTTSTGHNENYHNAVHKPTEVAIAQIKQELASGSITDPAAIQNLNEAVNSLSVIVSHDDSVASGKDPVVQQNAALLLSSLSQILEGYNDALAEERITASTSMCGQQQSKLTEAPVLEKPPLAPQIVDNVEEDHSQQDEDLTPQPRVIRQATKGSQTFSDQNLKRLPAQDSKSCGLSSLASSFCSAADIQSTVDSLAVSVTSAVITINNARQLMLSEMTQTSSCFSPEMIRKQMTWSSLGTATLPLTDVLRSLISIKNIQSQLSQLTPSSSIVPNAQRNNMPSIVNGIGGNNAMSDLLGNNPLLNLLSSASTNGDPLSDVTNVVSKLLQNNPAAALLANGANPLNGVMPSGMSNIVGSSLGQVTKVVPSGNSNPLGGLLGIFGK